MLSGNLCLNKTTVQNLKSKFRLIECSSCCGRVRTQFTTNLSEQDRAKTFLHYHDSFETFSRGGESLHRAQSVRVDDKQTMRSNIHVNMEFPNKI